MINMEEEIRAIVREEIAKGSTTARVWAIDERGDAWGLDQRKKVEKESTRHDLKWSSFETDLLANAFDDFCRDRAAKTGRSVKSISCKVRRLMYEGYIKTWE